MTDRLRLLRRRAQPAALTIARLVITAMVAYLIADWLLPISAPLLAPLTALLVVQVSLYRTLRHAFERVVSVTAGVLVAVVLVSVFPFSWLSLAIAILASLVIGYLLKLGDHLLEVPISAMLILQVGTDAAAADRIVETLIGAAVGLVAGLIAPPVRLRPAEEAITDLGESAAALLDRMADGLDTAPDDKVVAEWSRDAQNLGHEIQRVEKELAAASEAAHYRPRAWAGAESSRALRSALETLERATVIIRGLAASIADRTGLYLRDSAGLGAEMWEADVREKLAGTLHELASSTRDYAAAVTAPDRDRAAALTIHLNESLAEGRRQRDDLSWLLREDPGHWPLHGELLVHLDRLLDGLRDGQEPVRIRMVVPARPKD